MHSDNLANKKIPKSSGIETSNDVSDGCGSSQRSLRDGPLVGLDSLSLLVDIMVPFSDVVELSLFSSELPIAYSSCRYHSAVWNGPSIAQGLWTIGLTIRSGLQTLIPL